METNNFSLKITKIAKNDLENIFKYISIELANKTAAENLINIFKRRFNDLCIFPISYPLCSNEFIKYKTIRKLIVQKYIVFYKVEQKDVVIIRVLHELMDFINIL